MSATTGKLTVKFLSDWHVGEGASGFGHIDRLVRRDASDQLPYVPAKTVTGILRDACERAAYALDDGSDGKWSKFCRQLFGVQSKGATDTGHTTDAAVWFGPAHYSEALRQALNCPQQGPALRHALTFIKPGSKIGADGMSMEKMLRLEEVAVAGSELEADWWLGSALTESQRSAALALLYAGTRIAERLGAKRRRGNGRCLLTLGSAPPHWKMLLADDPPELTQLAANEQQLQLLQQGGGGFIRLAIELRLLAPVVVPGETLGNVVVCRDHIPGTLLLPALDGALRKALAGRAGELTALLAAGRIQVRNAYPAQGKARALPVPLAFEAEKENPGEIRNGFFSRSSETTHVQYKPLREGYTPEAFVANAASGTSPICRSDIVTFTHATIDDSVQRPTSAVGGVYTYQALAPDQVFVAELWVESDLGVSIESLKGCLPGEVRIGRAKKDDYGRVALEAHELAVAESMVSDVSGGNDMGEATLWLTSPLLERDERLRPVCDGEALCAALQRRLPKGQRVSLIKDRSRAFREEGWMNAWREPRPSRIGLAAGSCFALSFDPPLQRSVLQGWERHGLGERRGEGYGEVRVNPALLSDEKPKREDLLAATAAPQAPLSIASSEFTRALLRRTWRTSIRAHVLTHATGIAETMGWADGTPGNSQLGALRSHFETWTGDRPSRERLKSWWEGLLAIPSRAEQWPKASTSSSSEQNRIGRFGTDKAAVWQALKESGLDAASLPLFAGHEIKVVQSEMDAEATRIYWLTAIGVELDRRAQAVRNNSVEVRHGA